MSLEARNPALLPAWIVSLSRMKTMSFCVPFPLTFCLCDCLVWIIRISCNPGHPITWYIVEDELDFWASASWVLKSQACHCDSSVWCWRSILELCTLDSRSTDSLHLNPPSLCFNPLLAFPTHTSSIKHLLMNIYHSYYFQFTGVQYTWAMCLLDPGPTDREVLIYPLPSTKNRNSQLQRLLDLTVALYADDWLEIKT